MDDQAFEQWSENLAKMRSERVERIDEEIQKKGPGFESQHFFQTLRESLEEIVMKWWNIEQQAWEASPPEDKVSVRDLLKNEMESVIDFELETFSKDLAHFRKKASWQERTIQKDQADLFSFSEDLRKDYRIKIEALGVGQKKTPVKEAPVKEVKRPPSRTSGGATKGGTGGIFLFLLGIILGGAGSVTYWHKSKEEAKKFQTQMAEVNSEKRAIEDRLIMIEGIFKNLAYDKMRNIPEIQKDIKKIRSRAEARRQKIRKYYSSRRENLLKNSPPGDKLDRSIKKLDEKIQKEIVAVNAKESKDLIPFLKELKAFSDILAEK